MTNYYQDLGVAPNATAKEIKAAYRRLVLTTHPDKVAGKEAEFDRIQAAYDVLGDPTTRRAYDASQSPLINLSNPASYIERFDRQGLLFYLLSSPEDLDLYTYFNRLFRWQGDKAITPTNLPNHDVQWEMLSYVGSKLFRREQALQRDRYPSAAVKEELRLIDVNTVKIGLVLDIIVASPQHRKRLYDGVMGFDDSAEIEEITHLLGGKAQLARFMKNHPDLTGAEAVFDLRQVDCLTPANFEALLTMPRRQLSDVSSVINRLLNVNLLTQANFDRLIHQKTHSLAIIKGLSRLNHAKIFTQDYFNIVVNAGIEAENVGNNLEMLSTSRLLTTATINIIKERIFDKDITDSCIAMCDSGELNQETSEVLMWQGLPEVQPLNQRLDQLIAYGIYLLSCDAEKGKLVLLHGLSLKKEVKNFFELSLAEQEQTMPAFKDSFLTHLHSQDAQMGVHREEWKVIIANLAIALTGLGLIALGIQYAATGHGFFASTQRQKLVEEVAQDLWLTPK